MRRRCTVLPPCTVTRPGFAPRGLRTFAIGTTWTSARVALALLREVHRQLAGVEHGLGRADPPGPRCAGSRGCRAPRRGGRRDRGRARAAWSGSRCRRRCARPRSRDRPRCGSGAARGARGSGGRRARARRPAARGDPARPARASRPARSRRPARRRPPGRTRRPSSPSPAIDSSSRRLARTLCQRGGDRLAPRAALGERAHRLAIALEDPLEVLRRRERGVERDHARRLSVAGSRATTSGAPRRTRESTPLSSSPSRSRRVASLAPRPAPRRSSRACAPAPFSSRRSACSIARRRCPSSPSRSALGVVRLDREQEALVAARPRSDPRPRRERATRARARARPAPARAASRRAGAARRARAARRPAGTRLLRCGRIWSSSSKRASRDSSASASWRSSSSRRTPATRAPRAAARAIAARRRAARAATRAAAASSETRAEAGRHESSRNCRRGSAPSAGAPSGRQHDAGRVGLRDRLHPVAAQRGVQQPARAAQLAEGQHMGSRSAAQVWHFGQ